MTINRAPFNALVDDSGAGLDGSIWNKAAIKNVLLDPIDAIGPVTAYTPTWKTDGAAPVLGTGLLSGFYVDANGHVTVTITLSWGSTTTGGTGSWSFTLPFAPRAGVQIWGTGHALGPPYVPLYALQAANDLQPVYSPGGTTETTITAVAPFTWATGMVLTISCSYFR